MMKTYFIVVLLTANLFPVLSSGQISFQKNFGADSTGNYGQSVVQASDSGYFVAGVRVSGVFPNIIGEGILKRTDKYGNEIRTNYYSTPGSDDLTFDHMEITSDSNLVLAGVVNYGLGNYDVYLTKMDTAGNVLWYKNYGGDYRQRGLQVKETFDNGFIIGGWNEVTGSAASSSLYLIKTNSIGDTLWTRAYPNNSQQYGFTVAQTPDSGYVIAGNIWLPTQLGTDIFIIKTNASGDTLWTKVIDYSGSGEARDIAVSENGNIIISGWIAPAGCADPFLAELDLNGNILWFQTYDNGFCEWNYSLCKTNDNGYALFGMDHSSDYYLIKTDSAGNEQWYKKFDERSADYGYNVRQTSDDGFIMTGIAADTTSINIILIKTDGNGNISIGLNEIYHSDELKFYPNPSTGIIYTELVEKTTISFYNVTGALVKSVSVQPGEIIDLNELTNGIYFTKFNSENHNGSPKIILSK